MKLCTAFIITAQHKFPKLWTLLAPEQSGT